ncbi:MULTISPECIES: DoxX family protein [unclassified Streptomyces]|uniref:DoxX family protein n=1 Tax=unclassified Streptomyces TaxID=2593676 RepID=UPI00226DF1A0|nr:MULTISPECIES: DoxX family protein [unclassified Streptomyces]MCY0920346.1 DoxX family protein [Streptomyces sp. H27-G5]MCY0957246.1 DoxX family protein [Streptomyces sp. H27-H5]
MNTAATIVAVLAAAMSGFSGYSLLSRATWVVEAMNEYRVPQAWWTPLGAAKALGAIGLVVGIFLPVVGIAAGIGLVLYYLGAVITVIKARSYAHIPFPVIYMAPVVGAFALGFAL